MIIFIPVLFICVNASCEFMQATRYESTEKECRSSIETQKQHMRNLTKEAGQGSIEVLEGTCIDIDTRKLKGRLRTTL